MSSNTQTETFYPKNQKSEPTNNKCKPKVNYFKWILSSWTHPGTNVEGAKWYGIVTIVAELLVFFGALYRYFHVALSNSYFGVKTVMYMLSGSKSSIAELLIYLQFFAFSLIAAAVIIGGTYLVSRYLVSGEKENFWDYINRLTHYCGINVILTLIILVLGLFSIWGQGIVLLTSLSLGVFTVATLVAVTNHSNEAGLDRVYAGIITMLVISLGYVIFYLCANHIISRLIMFGIQVFMMMLGGGVQ